jgi:hypothetical protein
VLGGLAIGLLAATALSVLVSGFLVETGPRDPWVYAGVAAMLVATGIIAALLPARRAARGRSACRVARGVVLMLPGSGPAAYFFAGVITMLR